MAKSNIDKIAEILDKCDIIDQVELYQFVKLKVTENITKQQKQKEEEANELQSKIDKINGNS